MYAYVFVCACGCVHVNACTDYSLCPCVVKVFTHTHTHTHTHIGHTHWPHPGATAHQHNPEDVLHHSRELSQLLHVYNDNNRLLTGFHSGVGHRSAGAEGRGVSHRGGG